MVFSQVMEHRVYLDVHESIIYLEKTMNCLFGLTMARFYTFLVYVSLL